MMIVNMTLERLTACNTTCTVVIYMSFYVPMTPINHAMTLQRRKTKQ